MDRHAIALVLEEIGTLLELQGENRFKARAFLNAARALERAEGDMAMLARTGGLERVAGIGPATANVVRELVESGASPYLADLRARTPRGFRELLMVPGLGATKVRQLHQQLGIQNVADLERAAAEGRIAGVRGFGAKMQEKIAHGVQFVRGGAGRRRLARALESADRVIGQVRALPGVRRAQLGGELRRCLETVDGIDVVATVEARRMRAALDAFVAMPGAAGGAVTAADRADALLGDGLALRLRCAPAASFGVAWIESTGSEPHAEGLRIAAGITGVEFADGALRRGARRLNTPEEEDVYRELSLPWIPPELRESGRDEILAAADTGLPRLLDYDDVRGCFHCHTTASDGKATLEEMAEGALARGWRYLGIADHSQAAGYAGGLAPADIARQHDAIDRWNDSRGAALWLFKGIEADILADGTLDYAALGDAVLGSFDYVVGSVHSGFGMPRAQMTRRVLRALENPFLTFLGHPTGRLLLIREGYAIDLDEVIAAAGARGVGIEINADPHRMEMDWRHWRDAKAKGVVTAINPDAHSVRELDNVRLGTTVARKGWLEAGDVVNAWELDAVRDHFARKGS